MVATSPYLGGCPPAYVSARAAPCLVVLDMDCRILSAEPLLAEVLGRGAFDWEVSSQLPPAIEAAVRATAGMLLTSGDPEAANSGAVVVGRLLVRTSLLTGPSGSCLAVSLEELRRRDPVRSAVDRFRLTNREREVLHLIISGFEAREIAAHLNIAASTVGEHFKHLNEKMGARSRSTMLARVFAES